MSLHAIFKFENIDSTRDLNDRFKDLFAKGIYQGGKLAINSYGTVVISPFKAMSYDGMAVLSDEPTALSIPLTGAFYIVLKAKYDYNNPILEITYLDSTSSLVDDDAYIRFGKIVDGKEIDYSVLSRDTLDKLGRNPFKGIYYDGNKPEETIEGDMWFVINEGYCEIKVQSGANPSDVTTFTSSTAIEDRLARHIENQLRSSEGSTEAWDGDWGNTGCVNSGDNIRVYNAAKQYNYENILPNITEPDMFGSYHVSINKWFATENIGRTWDLSSNIPNNGTKNEFEINSNSRKLSKIKSIINAHDTRANSGDESPISVQLPSNDNKFITQNYPVLPTYDEKTALSGNILDTNDDAPRYDNRFLVQQTIGFKINKCSAIRVTTSEPDKYCYKIFVSDAVDSNSHLYLPGIIDGSSDVDASGYFSFTIKSEAYGVPTFLCVKKNEHASGVTPSTITLSTLSQNDYMTTPSKFNGKNVLKSMSGTNVVDYYLVSSVELVGSIYFYVSCRIEDSTPAKFNNVVEKYSIFENIGLSSGKIYVNDSLQVIKNTGNGNSNNVIKVSYDSNTVLRYYGNSLVINDGSISVLDLSYNNGTIVQYANGLLIKYGDNSNENTLRISFESNETKIAYYGNNILLQDSLGNNALKISGSDYTQLQYYGNWLTFNDGSADILKVGYSSSPESTIISFITSLKIKDENIDTLVISYNNGSRLAYRSSLLLSDGINDVLRISFGDSYSNATCVYYFGDSLTLAEGSNSSDYSLRISYNRRSIITYRSALIISDAQANNVLKIKYNTVGGSTDVQYYGSLQIKNQLDNDVLNITYDSANNQTVLTHPTNGLNITDGSSAISFLYSGGGSVMYCSGALRLTDGGNDSLTIGTGSTTQLTYTHSLTIKTGSGNQQLIVSSGSSITDSSITYTVGGKDYYVLLSDKTNGGIKYLKKDVELSGNDSTALYFA